MFEKFIHNGELLAIIISHSYDKEGIHFFTEDHHSQQIAYMKRPKNYKISPHIHLKHDRVVSFTYEVLYIKSGKVRVDFYDSDKNYLESRVLVGGDTVLLAHGGHGFVMLEESEIIETKQGPYCENQDKIKFTPPAPLDPILR
jgi:hypothetical protein